METQYNPADIEQKWYDRWISDGVFDADPDPERNPYCIVIPPPNVTGILHMGHALNNTIQDVLIRARRMQGYSSCWMPGTDHAGIATQNVVERKLARQGVRKEDVGREKFNDMLWDWKNEYGSTIISQLKRLGASCDWRRTRFTMDGQYSESVREVFVELFNKGLVYRGNRIVNWCPRCETALADEEAPYQELDSNLWHLRYPVVEKGAPDAPDYVVVATTRPETMLGDTALAINPDDTRYDWLKKSKVMLPLMDRELRIIEDELIEIGFGTGVVKVTPAHDPNDFMMGKKHGLEFINIMDKNGVINASGGRFAGMDRFEARKAVVAAMDELGLLEKVEPYKLNAGRCYRCDTIIEPRLSPQWYVNMKPLAGPAIEAVEDGRITFTPERWKKVYLNWMYNIQDWCISRQIWWGHRIPVWYCLDCRESEKIENGESKIDSGLLGVYASKTDLTECPKCGSKNIRQDPDVLDTWFSSWLWPFATFGWPFRKPDHDVPTPEGPRSSDVEVQKADLKYFYPTDTLVTASEILFFWVARMIMAGLEFMGDIPFSNVYIHGTVRDDKGVKMSKSLGNTIDPLEIIDKFGADALRFSLMMLCASGSDVYLSEDKFLVGRNFANKIWNATRFILSKVDVSTVATAWKPEELTDADIWILASLNRLIDDVRASLDACRINDAVKAIYDYFWSSFCDWYLEISKVETTAAKPAILVHVLKTVMKLLHPVMPFLTEEIYQKLRTDADAESIVIAAWPQKVEAGEESRVASFLKVQELVAAVRSFKKDLGVTARVDVAVTSAHPANIEALRTAEGWVRLLGRTGDLFCAPFEEPSVGNATLDYVMYLRKSDVAGIDEHKKRIEKRVKELDGFIVSGEKKLANKNFVERAPEEVVAGARETIENNRKEKERLLRITW